MSLTTLDRTAFTALVDDDGTGTTGTVFAKATYQDIYDKTDAVYAALARVQVYKNATQSIPNSTFTAVTFDSEDTDDMSAHSTVTNTSRLTVPTGMGGVYFISASVPFAANATGTRQAVLFKNGVVFATCGGLPGSAGNIVVAHTVALVPLAAADFVEVFAFQDSG